MDSDKKNSLGYRYFFILGNTPILSSAEIFAVLGRQRIPVRWMSVSEEVIVVETDTPIDPSALMATLGGTVKIGRMFRSAMTTEQWVRSHKQDGRIVVGVSVYKAATGIANATCDETLRALRKEILTCKRVLQEEGRAPLEAGRPMAAVAVPSAGRLLTGRALRLVTGRERTLSSVALVTEHMLERGGELVALVAHHGIQLGETIAVQAFHEYRHRDMGRPRRDARRGMLPPKVAQMMVNLAGAPDGGIVCDPFCGSGTILQEAMLLGYNIVGSDISKEAVENTQKNLQFLISLPRRQAGNFQQNSKFFVSDVRELANHLAPHSIDAIVTEPYLGPPLTGKESPVLLGKIRRDVRALVTDAFQSFCTVLRSGGRVVIVFPVLGGELLPIDGIEKLGWSLHTEGSPRMGGRSLTSRNTILYGRDDQHLAREITVWTPLEVLPPP